MTALLSLALTVTPAQPVDAISAWHQEWAISQILADDRPVERWRPLVEAFFPEDQVDTAMRVMACESGGNPQAKNPTSTAAGLFQFLRGTWNWVADEIGLPRYRTGAPTDPVMATKAAVWLQQTGGWAHWECW